MLSVNFIRYLIIERFIFIFKIYFYEIDNLLNDYVIGGWSAVCDDIGRLKLHPSNKISFDTGEAGPGEISGNVGDQPFNFEMTSNNRLRLIPPQISAGEHRLEILFNGTPFPGAPKLAIVQDSEVSS